MRPEVHGCRGHTPALRTGTVSVQVQDGVTPANCRLAECVNEVIECGFLLIKINGSSIGAHRISLVKKTP